jgi:nucleotide-binding universal stress UspA family protein
MKFSKILVPVSGEAIDKELVELACKVAKEAKNNKEAKSKVYVVYVIRIKRSLPLDSEFKPEIQKAESALTRAEEIADEQDYEVETDLLQAREEGPAIVDEAVERGIDLIVMAASYSKRFELLDLGDTISYVLKGTPFNLGDTVSYVLKNAPCRVLLLHSPTPC